MENVVTPWSHWDCHYKAGKWLRVGWPLNPPSFPFASSTLQGSLEDEVKPKSVH